MIIEDIKRIPIIAIFLASIPLLSPSWLPTIEATTYITAIDTPKIKFLKLISAIFAAKSIGEYKPNVKL